MIAIARHLCRSAPSWIITSTGQAPRGRKTVPWDDTIIYEMHVRGYTKRHPAISPELQGTYAGIGTKEVFRYIKSLGVTSVELLPVHTFINDSHLLEKGLTNYWGYNTNRIFAPDPRYAASRPDKPPRIQGDDCSTCTMLGSR